MIKKEANMPLGCDISITFHELIEKCKLNIINSFIQYKISQVDNISEKIKIIEKYHNAFNKSAQYIKEIIAHIIQDYENGIISPKVFLIEMKLLNGNVNSYLLIMDKINSFLEEMINETKEERIVLNIKNMIENNRKIENEFKDIYRKIFEKIEKYE
jgi:tetrahydromethanopterin S-methyltransferase subunit B